MVQRDQWDTYWGPKIVSRCRGGRGHKAAAPVESCQIVVRRSPWRRLGSILDMGKRLYRTRGGFHRCIHISKVLCALLLWTMICQRFRSRALWGAPSTGACGVGDYPIPDLPRDTSTSRSGPDKSVQVGPDGAPFASKTPITRGPPGIVIAVSLGPILPHR